MRAAVLIAFSLALVPAPAASPKLRLREASPRAAQAGDYDRVVPSVVDGGGWRTTFYVTNPDKKPAYFLVEFLRGDASDMQLPVLDIGATTGVYGDLAPGETAVFATEGKAQRVQEGYALFYLLDRTYEDKDAKAIPGPLAGMAILHCDLTEKQAFETTVPFSPRYEHRFTLPYDNRPGGATALVLINTGARSSPVSLTVRDDAGNVLKKDTVTVEPRNRIWGSIPELYSQTAGRVGSIQVSSSSVSLTGMGMREIAAGGMTVIPVLSTDLDPDAPTRPALPSGPLPGFTNTACSVVEGVLLFADDGRFLGRVTTDRTAADSITNTNGPYGSTLAAASIFNPNGKYGGDSAALSPFNPFTTKPPVMFVEGKATAYLTLNKDKGPAVDTNSVLRCAGRL